MVLDKNLECPLDYKEIHPLINIIYVFIFGCTGASLLCASCLVAESRSYSSCREWASRFGGFSCFRAQVLGARSVVATGRL